MGATNWPGLHFMRYYKSGNRSVFEIKKKKLKLRKSRNVESTPPRKTDGETGTTGTARCNIAGPHRGITKFYLGGKD